MRVYDVYGQCITLLFHTSIVWIHKRASNQIIIGDFLIRDWEGKWTANEIHSCSLEVLFWGGGGGGTQRPIEVGEK